jgi:hypothetical protein
MAKKYQKSDGVTIRRTIISILAEDVIAAVLRMDADNSPAARRDFIRSVFAAIEGIVWTYRMHVVELAQETDALDAETLSALSETSFSVNEHGKIHKQARFISLVAMIRLVTRIAERFAPGLHIDFSTSGWADFKSALAIRHRLTHPKSLSDLDVDDASVHVAWNALMWLCNTTEMAMQHSLDQATHDLELMRTFVQPLLAGEQWALDLYHRAASSFDV